MGTINKRKLLFQYLYVGSCIFIPVLILASGEIIYAIIGTIIVFLLYLFDPAYRVFKKSLPTFTLYFFTSIFSGLILSGIGLLETSLRDAMFAVWVIPTTAYNAYLGIKMEKLIAQ